MSNYRHKQLSSRVVASGIEEFDLTDKQGRLIGVTYTILEITSRPYVDGDGCLYYALPFSDPIFHCATVQATHDGQKYGASQAGKSVVSLEEARAEVARRIENTRKRYAKKYGG
jgi:hypothetical protein